MGFEHFILNISLCHFYRRDNSISCFETWPLAIIIKSPLKPSYTKNQSGKNVFLLFHINFLQAFFLLLSVLLWLKQCREENNAYQKGDTYIPTL